MSLSQPASNRIQVVLFDVGGVLVELHGVTPMLEWLEHRITTDELLHRWLHSQSVRAFESGKIDADTFARELLGEFDIQIDRQHFLDAFTAWPVGLFPGALEMIARIPEHYTRAILSNTNSLHWPRVLGEMGLGTGFHHYFASHLIGRIKPEADAFEHVVETLGCHAGSVLFLDDNQLNVEAARRVGMQAHVVQGVQQAQRVLEQAGIIAASQ